MELHEPTAAIRRAVDAVVELHPRLARIEARIGPLKTVHREANLEGLVRTILGQQISALAAERIYLRLKTICEGHIDGLSLLRLSDLDLRKAGLSQIKLRAVRELAGAELSGQLELSRLKDAPFEACVTALCRYRGIGPWTAEVFALFALGYPDAFPASDLALQKGYAALSRKPVPTAAALKKIAERWRPYRSGAAVLLWHQYHAEIGLLDRSK